ncbi:MAG: PKD domain-containing protein, partial [Nanoarchaeota archaeon]
IVDKPIVDKPIVDKPIVDKPIVEKREYYVCVSTKAEDNYKIRREVGGKVCGGTLDSSSGLKFLQDFEIYARPTEYAGLKNIVVDKEFYKNLNGRDLINLVNDYLNKTYNNQCEKDCILPVVFWGGSGNSAILKNAHVRYDDLGATVENKKLYFLNPKDFAISLNYTQIDLDKFQIPVPKANGTYKFELSLGKDEILEESINVIVGFNFSIEPRRPLIKQKTSFKAFGSEGIVSSTWNFGDGSQIINSNAAGAEHTYSKEGEYVVEVTIKKSGGESSTKKFKIFVGDPKKSVQVKIANYEAGIKNSKEEINQLDIWIANEIKKETKIEEDEVNLKKQKDRFSLLGINAKSEDYEKILDELLNIDPPYSISISEEGSLPGEISFNNIDPKYMVEISGANLEEISDKSEIKLGIINWNNEFYNLEVNFKTVSSFSELGQKNLLKSYKVEIEKKEQSSDEDYLIIQYPFESIKWKSDYGAESVGQGSATYLPLSGSEDIKEIEFLILGNAPLVENLPIYVSPVLDKLGAVGKPFASNLFDEQGNFRWRFFLGWTSFLLLGFLVIYLILQSWYKRHYEKSLFKNPDDLYNLINFIYNARKAYLEDRTTREKLLEKKWKKEQIVYGFKKMDGKRTGMWEIPVFKFLENRKVRKEIQKKQGQPVDIRFIKSNYIR